MHSLIDTETDTLSTTFAALADPTRRAILARLASEGERTVKELAAPFPQSLQAISKHLKTLERAGLVTRGRDRQLRPSRLRAQPLQEADLWLSEYRAFWEERFDRLEEHLRSIRRAGADPHESRRPAREAASEDRQP